MCSDSLKPYEKTFEFILPRKYSFYGTETFFKNRKIEHGLATAFGFFPVPLIGIDVGFHSGIEDLLAILSAVKDPIKAHR